MNDTAVSRMKHIADQYRVSDNREYRICDGAWWLMVDGVPVEALGVEEVILMIANTPLLGTPLYLLAGGCNDAADFAAKWSVPSGRYVPIISAVHVKNLVARTVVVTPKGARRPDFEAIVEVLRGCGTAVYMLPHYGGDSETKDRERHTTNGEAGAGGYG